LVRDSPEANAKGQKFFGSFFQKRTFFLTFSIMNQVSRTLLPDAIPFQTDLEAVLAAPPPRFLRSTTWLAAGFLAALVLVASVAQTDMMVTGTGTLQADTPPFVLQPMERAIIRTLRVRAGDHVVRGQVVATLDPTFADADLEGLRDQAAAVAARIWRLKVELSDSAREALPPGDAAGAMEAGFHLKRSREFAQRVASFNDTIARDTAELATARNTVAALGKQLTLASSVASIRGELLRREVGSKLQFLEAENNRIQAERDLQGARDRMAELARGIDAAHADRQAYIAQWQREAMEDLISARAEQTRIDTAMAKARRLHDLIRLVAPADGIVLDVAPRAGGSVLHEAEPLMTILPAGAPLIADVSISSADIGNLAEGEPVLVKVDAFPYQRHGMLHGVVRSIGEESFPGRGGIEGGAVHRVRIALTDTALRQLPRGAALIPGMTVDAEVKIGARTVLGYFLAPITRGLGESLHEP
jgi:HlyD family secretion protein